MDPTSYDTEILEPCSSLDGEQLQQQFFSTSTLSWFEIVQWLIIGLLITYALHFLVRSIRYKQRAKWCSEVDVGSGGGVPVSLRRLVRKLLRHETESERRDQLAVVFEKLELLLNARQYPLSRSLLSDFEIFNPRTDPTNYAHVPARKVEQMEDRFLSLCQQVLSQSNFIPITKEEYEFSMREDYMSTIPFEIDWNALDDTPMKRFRQRRSSAGGKVIPTTASLGFDVAENADVSSDLSTDRGGDGQLQQQQQIESSQQPDAEQLLLEKMSGMEKLHDKLWAFRRGIGVDSREEWLLFEKIDHHLLLLFNRLRNIVAYTFRSIRRFVPGRLRSTIPSPQPVPPASNDESSDREQIATKGAITKNVVRRVTLHDVVAAAPISCIWHKSTLREPTYKEIVLIYRRTARTTNDPAQQESENPHAFFIKTFRDVPMADLSMTFPAKRIMLRPMDLIWFTGVLCTAAFTVISQVELSFLGVASIITLALVAVRIFTTYRYSRLYYQSSMLGFLYDRSVNSHDGVLLYLTEQLKVQQLKEMLLVYYFLVSEGPQTPSHLAQATERFVQELQATDKRRRPIAVKIAVRDTLKKLATLELVHPVETKQRRTSGTTIATTSSSSSSFDPQHGDSISSTLQKRNVETRYRALSPEAAIAKLQELWIDSFALTLPSGVAPLVV